MAESMRQKRVSGRVMHEFKHGELDGGAGGKGGKVKSRRQAIAIALSEAGASNRQSPQRNRRNLHRAERAEADGKTGQQAREGKSHVGADEKRESTRAMGGKDARKPSAPGRRGAATRARRSDGPTRQELYTRAQRKEISGRWRMTKQQLRNALGLR
jgi:hypothetical protein